MSGWVVVTLIKKRIHKLSKLSQNVEENWHSKTIITCSRMLQCKNSKFCQFDIKKVSFQSDHYSPKNAGWAIINKFSRYNKEKGVVPKRPLFAQERQLGKLSLIAQERRLGTHLPVLPGGEEVGVPGGDGQPADGGDVAGEGELELARGQVPHLDHPVGRARHEPLVAGLNSHRPVEVEGGKG